MEQNRARELAVILHADVVGSTVLVQRNELIAHERIHGAFRRLSETIRCYGGTTLELRGDALVAEFKRASDAVSAALEFQARNTDFNATLDDELAPRLRMGISVGEVIIADDTVTGAGVVLAQRIEQLAEAGGVCIQDAARQTVPRRLPFQYRSLGEHSLKGFDETVRVYAVVRKPGATLPAAEPRNQAMENVPGRSPSPRFAGAVTALVLLTVAALAWWRPWAPTPEQASVEHMALPLPDKPSIAVLPFTNISDDPEQEYFVDGLTEDLITDLSKLSGLFVIARNSAFTYKGKAVKVQQVARELGVRYVLEGSVRRAGRQLRINAQLVDATTGGHLWAERYDGAFADVLAFQDSVTRKIVTALAVNLTTGGSAKQGGPQTGNPEAYDAFLRGWSHYRRNTPEDFAKAVPYFERALELDPNYGRAYAALAAVYWSVVDKDRSSGTSTWSRALGINTEESRRREHANLQLAMKTPNALAYRVAAGRLSRQGQHETAVAQARRAVEFDPNDPVAYEAMAIALIYAGRPTESAEQIRQAMRLDPRFQHEYLYWLGLAQFGIGRFEETEQTLTRATRSNPDDDRALIVLAAAYGHLGRVREAMSAVEKADALRQQRQQRLTGPDMEVGVDVLLAGRYTLKDIDLLPFKEEEDRQRLREGLRLAGVPEKGSEADVSPTRVEGVTTIDALEARHLHDRGVAFVDVRGEESWRNGHIPGAVHLDLKTAFDAAALSAVVAKDQEVVIYCMGPRCLLSSRACEKAVSWGFTRVYYFRDGLPAWRASGLPIDVASE